MGFWGVGGAVIKKLKKPMGFWGGRRIGGAVERQLNSEMTPRSLRDHSELTLKRRRLGRWRNGQFWENDAKTNGFFAYLFLVFSTPGGTQN